MCFRLGTDFSEPQAALVREQGVWNNWQQIPSEHFCARPDCRRALRTGTCCCVVCALHQNSARSRGSRGLRLAHVAGPSHERPQASPYNLHPLGGLCALRAECDVDWAERETDGHGFNSRGPQLLEQSRTRHLTCGPESLSTPGQ